MGGVKICKDSTQDCVVKCIKSKINNQRNVKKLNQFDFLCK